MTMPERTKAQRMEALDRANCVRMKRAELKDELKCGRKLAADVLLHPPAFALKMKVGDLLLAVPRMGTVSVNKTLGMCNVSGSKTLGGLTDRQRSELARCVQRARVGTGSANHQPTTT